MSTELPSKCRVYDMELLPFRVVYVLQKHENSDARLVWTFSLPSWLHTVKPA